MTIQNNTYNETVWEISITTCPHCQKNLDLGSTSCISQKVAVGYLFDKIKEHQQTCFSTKKKMIKLKVVKKVKWSRKDYSDDISVDFHKIIL
jgi:hypothetical protein